MAAPQPQLQLSALLRQAGRLGLQALQAGGPGIGRAAAVEAAAASSAASASASSGCSGSLLLASRRCLATAAEAAAASVASTSGRAALSGAAPVPRGFRGLLHDYKQLSKFKLSSLVVMTAGAGFVAASGESIDYAKMAWTSLGTLGAAACANTLNQLYEVANDARMSRTRNRPLPAGRMGRLHAAAFAVAVGSAGLWILYEKANPLTAGLGAANILLYAGIYTPLKQLTVANTWVGAVVGAIPPLMGWASACGQLDAGAAVLAAALFFWQMPHFLALAWLCKADYMAGGFRMLSMLDPSGRRTALAALRHCAYVAPIGLGAVLAGFASEAFAWEAAALAAWLGLVAAAFVRQPSQQSARRLFKTSLLYLPLLLLGLGVHRLPNAHDVDGAQLAARALACVPQALRDGAEAAALRALHGLGSAGGALSDTLVANNIKCPSKAYGDSGDLELNAQATADAAVAAQPAAAQAKALGEGQLPSITAPTGRHLRDAPGKQ